MKKILVSGKKMVKTFGCWSCGCQFESDEFVTVETGKDNPGLKLFTDICPECQGTAVSL